MGQSSPEYSLRRFEHDPLQSRTGGSSHNTGKAARLSMRDVALSRLLQFSALLLASKGICNSFFFASFVAWTTSEVGELEAVHPLSRELRQAELGGRVHESSRSR